MTLARSPPPIPADTSLEAWRVRTAAIGRRSVAERLAEWETLKRKGEQMEANGVRRQHPESTDRQVFLTLVRRRDGDELACEIWPDARGVIWRAGRTLIDLSAAPEPVADALERAEIPYVVVGSTAAAAWGAVRPRSHEARRCRDARPGARSTRGPGRTARQ